MDSLFPRRPFTGFGPDSLHPWRQPAVQRVRGRRAGQLREQVRQVCPRLPGVYGMTDGRGQLVYVGKAKCLRARLLSYFRPKSRDPKAGRILAQTRAIVWESCFSEFAALLRELQLIHQWQPRFNVQGQPRRRRRTFVCIGRRPAPYVFLARRPPAGVLASFGPIPAASEAGAAVRWLNDAFRLRDCPQWQPMLFADQGELFPVLRAAGCLRHEIGTCLGPCAGACSRRAYAEGVAAARTFLEGRDTALLGQLEKEMAAASAALAFERAADLRDRREALAWLDAHLERLRHARRRHSFVYPVRAADGQEHWYLIVEGCVRGALPAPHDPEAVRQAESRIEAAYRKKPAPSPLNAAEMDTVLLVSAWFRRHPKELERTLEPGAAPSRFEACPTQGLTGIGTPPHRCA